MLDLEGGDPPVDGYRKIDNISDYALGLFQAAYGPDFSKDDIFHYVYGLLHAPDLRDQYRVDLRKVLPRIPLAHDAVPYVKAGQALLALHLGYESADRFPLIGLDLEPVGNPYEFFRVEKMAFSKERVDGASVEDLTSVIVNPRVRIAGIPEQAHRYLLGPKSETQLILDPYRVRTGSGVANDPNQRSREVGNPRYVLDLLARTVTVSVETMKIVDGLPPLSIPTAERAASAASALHARRERAQAPGRR